MNDSTQSAAPDPMSESAFAGSAEKLRHELERWIEAAMHRGEQTLDRLGLSSGRSWQPPVDVIETADDVLVQVDLPGVSSSSVDVKLAGQTLSISGERPGRAVSPLETVRTCERFRGAFQRSVSLPVPVLAEQTFAEMKDGILTIRFPKSELAKARKIPVGSSLAPAEFTPVATGNPY